MEEEELKKEVSGSVWMPLPLWATSEWERDSVKASEDEERGEMNDLGQGEEIGLEIVCVCKWTFLWSIQHGFIS